MATSHPQRSATRSKGCTDARPSQGSRPELALPAPTRKRSTLLSHPNSTVVTGCSVSTMPRTRGSRSHGARRTAGSRTRNRCRRRPCPYQPPVAMVAASPVGPWAGHFPEPVRMGGRPQPPRCSPTGSVPALAATSVSTRARQRPPGPRPVEVRSSERSRSSRRWSCSKACLVGPPSVPPEDPRTLGRSFAG